MSNKIERTSQEKRTAFVVVFTFVMMLAEVVVGLLSHSMALTCTRHWVELGCIRIGETP